MKELEKYKESSFTLPAVVDVIDFESHMVLDVIQVKGEFFKKGEWLKYKGEELVVFKKLKDHPIQTDASIENRLDVRKVRYFCNKSKIYDQKTTTTDQDGPGVRN